jgi:argonaute-like protein implicated in RNA metabolism and viral defense
MLLTFQSLSDAHTNETMIRIVVNILKKYKLKNRLLAVIIDNASNNEKMKKEMKKILKEIDIE